jgi:hypothetical protein
MKKARVFVAVVLVLILAVIQTGSIGAQDELTQLVMVLDGSGSIDHDDWVLMLYGLADSIENPKCFPQNGSVELTVIQFSSSTITHVPPTIVKAGNAAGIAADIRDADDEQLGSGTDLALGIDVAVQEVRGSDKFLRRNFQVMNISTDGETNEVTAEASRDAALRTFDEIDAEAVGTGPDVEWLRDEIVYPEPGTAHGLGYDKWPPDDPGWVRYVVDFEQYAKTLCKKFKVVVPPEPEPEAAPPFVPEASTLLLLGSAASGLAGYVGLQIRARRRK